MLEFLEFVFRDFWTFWGCIVLIFTIGFSIALPISELKLFNK